MNLDLLHQVVRGQLGDGARATDSASSRSSADRLSESEQAAVRTWSRTGGLGKLMTAWDGVLLVWMGPVPSISAEQ